jgi:hypothetical protein
MAPLITQFRIDSPSEMAQWDDFVNSHEKGTPFHLSYWLRTIHDTYSFKPLLCVSRDEHNCLSGVLPFFQLKSLIMGNRLVSVPFSDFCPPLFRNKEDELQVIQGVLDNYSRKIKYIEIRGSLSENSGFCGHSGYKHHFLKLSSNPLAVKNKFNKKTIIYSIRKAENGGVEIVEDNSEKGMQEFYKLNILTRKKHGIPPQPKNFFVNIFRHIITKGHGTLRIALWNSKPIAAGLFLQHKDTVYYKYNASDPVFMLRKSPNHLLTWAAIEKACRAGYLFFDFGRTSVNNAGLNRYKEMWGAESRDLTYFNYPPSKEVASKNEKGVLYQAATRCWRLMPSVISSKIGPLIYKHLG